QGVPASLSAGKPEVAKNGSATQHSPAQRAQSALSRRSCSERSSPGDACDNDTTSSSVRALGGYAPGWREPNSLPRSRLERLWTALSPGDADRVGRVVQRLLLSVCRADSTGSCESHPWSAGTVASMRCPNSSITASSKAAAVGASIVVMWCSTEPEPAPPWCV